MKHNKKKILITGGSGFLGRNLALALDKKKYEVIICSRNNTINLFSSNYANCKFHPVDITNYLSINEAISQHKPDIIIHAAATKFVDLSIKFPNECIDVNVIGSQNVARSSVFNKVKLVIGISTDKATPPTKTIYGTSKLIMEQYFTNLNSIYTTKFLCIRFGNIAWSSGSVLPIWYNMLEKNKNITTTGPEMTRFLFSVQDACDLIIRVINHYKKFSGKIVTCDMKKVKILKLLETFTKIYKCEWKLGNKRAGDQDYETLIGPNEIKNTYITYINKIKHYIIDANKEYNEVKKSIKSSEAEHLDNNTIRKIILEKPDQIL